MQDVQRVKSAQQAQWTESLRARTPAQKQKGADFVQKPTTRVERRWDLYANVDVFSDLWAGQSSHVAAFLLGCRAAAGGWGVRRWLEKRWWCGWQRPESNIILSGQVQPQEPTPVERAGPAGLTPVTHSRYRPVTDDNHHTGRGQWSVKICFYVTVVGVVLAGKSFSPTAFCIPPPPPFLSCPQI